MIGLPLVIKMNWSTFTGRVRYTTIAAKITTINNVSAFDEESELRLEDVIADSVRIMFRFTPNTCDCLEPKFSEEVKYLEEVIGENRVIVVISARTYKDVLFFRERNKLSCSVIGTEETLSDEYDGTQTPYACIVFPDMTARHIVTIHPRNINELIDYVEKNIK